jgi:hypothetical protein
MNPDSRYCYKEAKALHYKLWDELSKTGSDWKGSTKTEKEFPALNECYCCEIVGKHDDHYMACSERPRRCPIKWVERRSDSEGDPCMYSGSLYIQWKDCYDKDARKRLAGQIRDLPWRDKD